MKKIPFEQNEKAKRARKRYVNKGWAMINTYKQRQNIIARQVNADMSNLFREKPINIRKHSYD